MENLERELKLRIILEKPPAGVDFGLQKGRGRDYETIQKQRSEAKDLCFEFTVAVKAKRGDAAPNFLGPLLQGPPGERFVYIDIGTYAGQNDSCWSRRLKVPLSGITWDTIEALSAGSQAVLEARVAGTGKDGGPSCGSVKGLDSWRLRNTRGQS